MPRPESPKLYHIVHMDKLPFIASDGFLFSDAVMQDLAEERGTVVGMNTIKQRRLTSELECQPGRSTTAHDLSCSTYFTWATTWM
jgi:hypothetical protein